MTFLGHDQRSDYEVLIADNCKALQNYSALLSSACFVDIELIIYEECKSIYRDEGDFLRLHKMLT